MMDRTRPQPIRLTKPAVDLAPDTIAAAAADADRAKRTALEMLEFARRDVFGDGIDDALGSATWARIAGAYAQLAVADETRALRLALTEQLRAIRSRMAP